jgi:CubicO group peptidase (beta-lactamase class C family)
MLAIRLAVCLFALLAILGAQTPETIVRGEMERSHIPAVAFAVIKDGKPQIVEAYGKANLEHGVDATPRTVFKIASVSKHFVAAAILLLAEDGKLSLSDSVRKFYEDSPDTWEPVTLRHLLSHTGGIVREGPAFDPFKIQPDEDVVRSAYRAPVAFAPGEKWQYCNTGYFAAADIIRKLSGKPWAEYIRDRIFLPAGMTNSRATSTAELVPHRADGYDWDDGRHRNATDYIAVRPSGAFLSTLEDLVKWDSALDTNVPLPARVRDAMWTPVALNNGNSAEYGLGWKITGRAGDRLYEHGGSLPGFRSHYARYPGRRLSVIVLANSSTAKPAEIASKLAALYY